MLLFWKGRSVEEEGRKKEMHGGGQKERDGKVSDQTRLVSTEMFMGDCVGNTFNIHSQGTGHSQNI